MEYSETFKRNAVRAVADGKTATEVCKGIGISRSTLRKWKVELGVTLPEGLSDSQIIWNLKNRLYEKQIELEIINNCSFFNNLSLSPKYLYLNGEPYFLTVIIDLFSRKVIGYDVVDSIAAFPLIKIFKKTFEERGKPEGLLFHSDQDSQFTAYRFKVLLRGLKVIQSFSAPSNPHDNAVAESFFRNIKSELIHRTVFKNITDMRTQIDDYIVFYNTVRPHSKIKNKTPEQFEKDYMQIVF